MKTKCWDCYVSNQIGYGPCHKQEHPMFAMLKNRSNR